MSTEARDRAAEEAFPNPMQIDAYDLLKAAVYKREPVADLPSWIAKSRRDFSAGWDARGQGAKLIRDFHGDDVWRDEQGVTWVRQSELVEAVRFNRGQVTPDKQSLIKVIDRADDSIPGMSWVTVERMATAILALFNEKGNEG